MSSLILWTLTLALAGMEAPATVIVSSPEALSRLSAAGLGLGTQLGSSDAEATADFGPATGWPSIARTLAGDLATMARRDPRSGPSITKPHRLFDASWLRDVATRFELIAVVNRLDRRPFRPEFCGETRLVYRLAYTRRVGDTTIHSRLPMTLNVVYWQKASTGVSGCKEVADRWRVKSEDAVSLRTKGGALSALALAPANLKSLEINMQTVRWPSTVHPSLGGHAEYLLRVFTRGPGGDFLPAKLENTPDVARLKARPRLKRALLAWLRHPANLKALDDGNARLPERFLGERSTSVTPRGLARLANRPFRQLFKEADFEGLDFKNGHHVKSAAGLLRRLDTQTCAGCHQSQSVAGFHLLGEDRLTMKVDALITGTSPHLHEDLKRRRRFVRSVAANDTPDDTRGLPERLSTGGKYASRCGLGDVSFAHFVCGEGLICKRLDDGELGVCLAAGAGGVGDPCEVGKLRSHGVGHRDRVRDVAHWGCQEGDFCETNAVGFPNGMCAGTCEDPSPNAVCGAIALLTPFNRCLARKRPFTDCISENVRPAALRQCSAEAPCRDDYVCARTPGGEGACLPPYFLFQLRVDGH